MILPYADNPGPRRAFPFVNYLLILANLAIFGYEVYRGPTFAACLSRAYSLVPADILHGTVVQPVCTSLPAPHPIYLTVLTAMFLHASLLHVGGNMLYLWVFGDNVEDRLGHFWYLVFYLVCGVAAFAAQIVFSVYAHETTVLTLGASGAIAGVLGAYLVFFPGADVRTIVVLGVIPLPVRVRAVFVIGFFILLQVAEAYIEVTNITHGVAQSGDQVAFFAHIGGFALGLVIALMVRVFSPTPTPRVPAAKRA